MIFLIDVDEVLADFANHVYDCTGIERPTTDLTWDIFERMTPEERERAEAVVNAEGFCESLPVCHGAQEGVESLRGLGCHMVAVTSPWKRSKTWGYERRLWLEKHFNITDVILTNQKFRVRGDYLLDDRLEHVVGWAESAQRLDRNRSDKFDCALLWATPFNRSVNIPKEPDRILPGTFMTDAQKDAYNEEVENWRRAILLDSVIRDNSFASWGELVGYVRRRRDQ